MDIEIKKWGNSIGIRIPKAISDELSWFERTNLKAMIKDKTLVLEERPRYTLEQLMDGVPDNFKADDAWEGLEPVGNEIF
jgi:antitoxin MazE